jgi:hypothetical protein
LPWRRRSISLLLLLLLRQRVVEHTIILIEQVSGLWFDEGRLRPRVVTILQDWRSSRSMRGHGRPMVLVKTLQVS